MNSLLRKYPTLILNHLGIGEGAIFDKPTAVQTVLGSCVSVTFYAPSKGLSAIFHALLPRECDYNRQDRPHNHFKYVDSAIVSLLEALDKRGVRTRELECKIFGGSNSIMTDNLNIGLKNVEAAMETLAAHGLSAIASDVGGKKGRKLLFITASGEVYVKRLG